MITVKDLYDIVGKKMANEASKAVIRDNMPPQIAEQKCWRIIRFDLYTITMLQYGHTAYRTRRAEPNTIDGV